MINGDKKKLSAFSRYLTVIMNKQITQVLIEDTINIYIDRGKIDLRNYVILGKWGKK